MILATQSVDELKKSDILNLILESCSTKIFLANPDMDRDLYQGVFHLNDKETDLITTLIPKQQMLIKRPDITKVVNLNVDPVSYWLYTSDPMDNLKKKEVIAQHGLTEGLQILARRQFSMKPLLSSAASRPLHLWSPDRRRPPGSHHQVLRQRHHRAAMPDAGLHRHCLAGWRADPRLHHRRQGALDRQRRSELLLHPPGQARSFVEPQSHLRQREDLFVPLDGSGEEAAEVDYKVFVEPREESAVSALGVA